jgi:uracil-DNA glycosylase family 4
LAEKFPDNTFVAPRWGTGRRLAIAEAPGETEAQLGEPLVGGAGRWLRGTLGSDGRRHGGMYKAAGVREETVTLVNVIQCQPPHNVFPLDSKARSYISARDARRAIEHCRQAHLEPVLQARPWERVDLFGDHALHAVTDSSESITAVRGTPMAIPSINSSSGPPRTIAIPTLHPAYIMRDQDMMPIVVNDLAKSTQRPPEHFNLYPSLADVEAFDATEFAFDIETVPADHNRITMVGLSARDFHALVVPFSGDYRPLLRRIFNRATRVVGQNSVAFDIPHLAANGIELSPRAEHFDLMLMHGLLFPEWSHSLDFIGRQFTSIGAWKGDKTSEERYNARDVMVTWLCFRQMYPMLVKEKLLDLYRYKSVPLQLICSRMEALGVRCDPQRFDTVRMRVLSEMAELEKQLPEALRTQTVEVKRRQPAPLGTVGKSGKPVKFVMVPATEQVVPWRSSDFKKKYLYETLGLPAQENPKAEGKITADKGALDKLIRKYGSQYPWLKSLKELSKLGVLLSGFLNVEKQEAGEVHPRFNVVGTATGRLSSASPNFQNQPPAAKYMYVPRTPEMVFIECDYRSMEGRLTAWFSRDTDRLERMNDSSFNEYKWAINKIEGTPIEEIEKDNSVDAPYGLYKRIILGLGYGLGARKIANMYGIPEAKVKRIMFEIKSKAFPRLTSWQEATGALAKQQGFLVTPFGRKRWFWTDRAYTESLAFLPQSSGADIVFNAMIGLCYPKVGWPEELAAYVSPVLKPLPAEVELLVQVHDALLFECPRPMVEKAIDCIVPVMEQPWPQLRGFALPVSVEVGESWGEMEPWRK